MYKHTEIINYLIERFNFQSYCELGVHDPSQNFDLIKCKFRIGVDPTSYGVTRLPSFHGTSDEFFTINKQTYSCVFIDGLHEYDQVKKDFENSLACLNEGGIILIHDTNPEKEEFARVPRNGLRGRWNGDVWRILGDLSNWPDIDYRTLKSDPNGLTIVKRSIGATLHPEETNMNWEYFINNREIVLGLVSDEEFKGWLS